MVSSQGREIFFKSIKPTITVRYDGFALRGEFLLAVEYEACCSGRKAPDGAVPGLPVVLLVFVGLGMLQLRPSWDRWEGQVGRTLPYATALGRGAAVPTNGEFRARTRAVSLVPNKKANITSCP